MGGGATQVQSRAVAVAHDTSRFLSVYPWDNSTGFGVLYANPVTLPTGVATGVAFSRQGDAVAVAHTVSPRFSVYPFNASSGIGVRYASPVTLPTGDGASVDFHPDGTAIAVGHLVSPFASAYPFSVSTGIGAKYANPSSLPPQRCLGIKFSPQGDYLAVVGSGAVANTGYRSIYSWSGSGFGARVSHASSQTNMNGVDWHPTGNAIAFSQTASNPIICFAVSSGVIGTQYASSSYGVVATGVAFNRAGTVCGISHEGTPYARMFPFSLSTGFGAAFSNPSSLATGNGRGIAFSHDDKAVALAHFTTPFASAWGWDNATGFGSKYANPSTLPTGNATGVAFCG